MEPRKDAHEVKCCGQSPVYLRNTHTLEADQFPSDPRCCCSKSIIIDGEKFIGTNAGCRVHGEIGTGKWIAQYHAESKRTTARAKSAKGSNKEYVR